MSAVDAECVRFLQSLPPPAPSEATVRVHMRARTDSDTFDIKELEREVRESIARQAAERISAERQQAAEKIAAEKQRADKAEARLEKQRQWWTDLARSIIGPLVVAAVIGVATVFYVLAKAVK